MDAAKLLKLHTEEIKRRFPTLALAVAEKHDFTDYNFPLQAQILQDKSRFQAWQCTRRFGKSTGFAKKVLNTIVNTPDSKALYLALTFGSSVGILWSIIEGELKSRSIEEGRDYRTDKTSGEFHFNNGGMLKFVGVNANYKEMDKILGQAYDHVGVDECGSMNVDMESLIMNKILASLTDRRGHLTLLGTSENIPNTFFEKVTSKQESSLDWSVYKCSTLDNPYMANQFKEDMDMILRNNPLAIEASWFKTHWLNLWCADDDLLIIRNDPSINEVDSLPDMKDWIYGLGVDLGFNDATSFTVNAMSPKSPYLYTLQSFKSPGLDFTGTAQIIRQLNQEYGFTFAEVDGANKQGVQEMQNRHDLGVRLTPAEKTDKAIYLRLFNDDYKQGKIKHIKGKCNPLTAEQSQLMWIKDSDKEDPRCENHCNDGALYIWRKMRTYFKAEVTPWKSKEQLMEDQFLKEGQELKEEMEEMSLLY